ncbi:hypothetical protein GCM10010252_30490 [Streptomyces aureoverticillatus]|nr:hypothetical protein GCM10010252_30490 [Streptomyces aureoverticillatus]
MADAAGRPSLSQPLLSGGRVAAVSGGVVVITPRNRLPRSRFLLGLRLERWE